jgi:hypothetical protein
LAWFVAEQGNFNLQVNSSSDAKIAQLTILRGVLFQELSAVNLDTTKNYWLVMADYGSSTAGNGRYDKWFYRSTSTGSISQHSFPTNIVPGINTTLGTGWAAPTTSLMWFAMPKRRSQAFQAYDNKAVVALSGGTTRAGYITSTLSSIPSYIKNKEAMYKYLSTQLYNMCRPQAVYNTATVTAPNVPILPGDPIMISDSVLGFSASGSTPTMTVCGDMNYSWGSPGGQGMTYEAPTILSIQPVGAVSRYR